LTNDEWTLIQAGSRFLSARCRVPLHHHRIGNACGMLVHPKMPHVPCWATTFQSAYRPQPIDPNLKQSPIR